MKDKRTDPEGICTQGEMKVDRGTVPGMEDTIKVRCLPINQILGSLQPTDHDPETTLGLGRFPDL